MKENNQNEITSNTFFNLYQKTSDDVEVVEIVDGKGITVVRNYNEKNDYFKDGSLMFIRVYFSADGFVCGGVDMVKKSSDGKYTIVRDENQYKKHFTNFSFNKEEKIKFGLGNGKFIGKKKKLNTGEFVDWLIKNHLADKLFFERTFKFKKSCLKFIFWLLNKKYDWLEYYNSFYGTDRKLGETGGKELENFATVSVEPFFKYFKIHINMLFFSILFIVLPTVSFFYNKANSEFYSGNSIFFNLFKIEYFTITNPIFIFSFFIILSLLHYATLYLVEQINNKDGWIHKLYLSSMNNNFSLKL